MSDLVVALGLVLAIEGLLFAGAPGAAREAASRLAATPDRTLRRLGVAAAFVGVALVWIVRG